MKSKILVIDDSSSIRQQVVDMLEAAGFATVEADDGLSGYEAFEANDDIALVVSDVNMPGLNGLELLEKIQKESSKKDVPFLMLTTEGSKEMIDKAKKLGAKGWLVKPFLPEQLVTAAEKLVAMYSSVGSQS